MHKRLIWLAAACIFVTGRVAHAEPSSGLPDELLHPNCGGGEKLRSRIIERIEVLSGRALAPKGLTDRDRTEISRLHTFDDVQRVCRSDGITDALGPDKLREAERRVEALKPDGPGPCRLDAEVRHFTKQDGPGRWPEPICGLIDLQNLRWSFDLDPARRLDALILNRKTAYADAVGQAYLHRIREEIAQTERRSQQIREDSAVSARKMNRMREEAAAWAQRMNRIHEKEAALQRKIAEDLNRRDCCAKGDYRKRLTPAEESP